MVAAQVCRAETTETGKPRLIQMMDDSNTYYTFCNTERPTAKHLEAMVDTFARADVDVLTMCLHCRWQAYYDSKVVEVAGDLSPEAVQPWEWTHYWHWLTAPAAADCAGGRSSPGDRGALSSAGHEVPGLVSSQRPAQHIAARGTAWQLPA